MKLVAQASKNRSLADFQTVSLLILLEFKGKSVKLTNLYCFQTVEKYNRELKEDKIVQRHLDSLYQTMLEQNLCRIIEPYSRVQV